MSNGFLLILLLNLFTTSSPSSSENSEMKHPLLPQKGTLPMQ
jgi:hypothetical protein